MKARQSLLAIDQDTPSELCDRAAVLGRGALNRYFIAGLECIPRPACADLGHRVPGFDEPVRGAPFIVLGIDLQENMGIGPNIIGHSPLHRYDFPHLVRRTPMVREHWGTNPEEAQKEDKEHCWLRFHAGPPSFGAPKHSDLDPGFLDRNAPLGLETISLPPEQA